jgi:hypothetical protein
VSGKWVAGTSDSGEGVPLVPFVRLWVVVDGSSDGCGVGGPVTWLWDKVGEMIRRWCGGRQ